MEIILGIIYQMTVITIASSFIHRLIYARRSKKTKVIAYSNHLNWYTNTTKMETISFSRFTVENGQLKRICHASIEMHSKNYTQTQ